MKKFWDWLSSDKVLLALAILLVIFNFIDGGLTWLLVVKFGVAIEANPFIAALLQNSLYLFFLYKFGFPIIASSILYRNRDRRTARIGLIFCFSIYLILMIYFAIGIGYSVTTGYL